MDFKSLVEENKRQTSLLNQIAGNPAESAALENVAKEIAEQGKDAKRSAAATKSWQTRRENAEAQKQKAVSSNESAETETKREQSRVFAGILKGISGLKTGILSLSTSFSNFAKEKAKALRGSLFGILKKAAFGAAMIAIIAFLNSEYWVKTKKYIMDTIVPAIKKFWEGTLKPFGEGIMKFFEDPTFENFKKIFDVENPLGLVAGLAGIATLLAPGLMFKGLKLGVKAFTKAAALAGTSLMNLGSDVETGKDGKTRDKKTGAFAKKDTGKLKGMKNLGKGLLRGAKFLPVVGVGVTALMGVFDGVTAGLEEAKNENATKSSILRESIAGIGSGLTFGLVSQETISNGITSMTTSIGNGFNKTKEVFTEGFTKVSSFVTEMELFKFVEGKIGEIWSSIKAIFTGDFSLENFTAIFGSVTDIIFKPIDMAVNAIKNMFGFGSPDEEFSLKTLISESLSKVGEFFSNLFDLDIRALASSIMPAKVVDFIFGKKVDTESDEFKGMSALDQAEATGLYDKDLIGNSELNTDLLAKATNAQLQAILDDDDISKENIKAIKSEQSKRSGADEFAGTGRKQERQYLLPANARSGIHGYRGTEEYEDILASQNERLSLRKRVRFADMKYKRIYGTPVANDNTKRGQALNDSSSELNSAKAEGSNVVIMNNQQQAPAQSNSQPVPIPVSTRDNSSSAAQSARVTQ